MCGLTAIFQTSDAPGAAPIAARLAKSLEALRHRGPDGSAVRVSANGRAGLGHARLSIIDVAGGAQPLRTADDAIWAVVNGEFYDFAAIRAELKAKGHVFLTQSDSEILLHLYREYGIGCLEFLRGEFAFVLYDQTRDLVFAARDRFGIKPLYMAEHGGCLVFSSEIKGIIAAGVPAQWDRHAYVSRAFTLGQSTLFKGISAVAPGHYVLSGASGPRSTKYWDFDFPKMTEPAEVMTTEAMVSAVHQSLRDAVAQRLVADVPLAFYLSGGLDSSAILGIAADLKGRGLPAFNLAFVDDPAYDERPQAELMAAHVGADFHPIAVTSDLLVDRFAEAVWHNEGPLANAHGVAKFILSDKVRRAGFKVVLTGEGADEVFAGYPHFRKDLLVNGLTGRSISWLETKQAQVTTLSQFYRPEAGADPDANAPFDAFLRQQDVRGQLEDRHPVHVSMYLWAKSRLPNFVLTTLGDRMEMANSIEGRVPFLDHHLVQLAAKIPVDLKINGRSQKYILREAVRRYLPETIFQRKKHYFEAPPVLRRPGSRLLAFLQDTLRSDLGANQPFFDPQKIYAALDSLASKTNGEVKVLEPVLMEIASLCLLQRTFHL